MRATMRSNKMHNASIVLGYDCRSHVDYIDYVTSAREEIDLVIMSFVKVRK